MMELLKGRRACWAVLASVARGDGSVYPDDDWRMQYIGKRGWFELLNRSWSQDAYHVVRFSDRKEDDNRSWSIRTGEITDIREDATRVILTTSSSVYRFEFE